MLDNIPNEVIQHNLLDFLSPKDVLKLRCLSKYHKFVVESATNYWKPRARVALSKCRLNKFETPYPPKNISCFDLWMYCWIWLQVEEAKKANRQIRSARYALRLSEKCLKNQLERLEGCYKDVTQGTNRVCIMERSMAHADIKRKRLKQIVESYTNSECIDTSPPRISKPFVKKIKLAY